MRLRYHRWLQTFTLKGRCPLCYGPCTAGQYCSGCLQDMLNSMQQHQHRCARCQLALDGMGYCHGCYLHKPHYHRLVVGFDYVPPMSELVLRYKNAGQLSLAKPFAHLLSQRLASQADLPPAGTLCLPVPSSHQALRRRGFNPATELARHLAKRHHWRLNLRLLYREQRRDDTQQKSLDHQQRRQHVSDLYYCGAPIKQAEVILVDDVMTSGATLNSVAVTLRRAGVQRVYAIVLARATYGITPPAQRINPWPRLP